MSRPTYDQFVTRESWEVRDAYRDAHGHDPAISDQYHTAWRRLVEGWTHEAILRDVYAGAGKPFPGAPTPPQPPAGALRGPLRVDGRLFRAGDGGRFVWRFCSAFTLCQHYATGRASHADAYLDWVQAHGFNGVRVFCGNLTWAGQTFRSALDGLPAVLAATAARGLYCELVSLTDTKDVSERDGEAHARAVAALAGPSSVLELSNEVGHGTQASWLTADWCRRIGRSLPVVWAVGAPVGQDEPINGSFPGHGGSYITSHLDRGRPFWDQVRRVRELFAIIETHKVPCVNNEPVGAGPIQQNGRRETNPTFFRALGALNSLFGVQGVFHLDAGLHCTLPSATESACARAFIEGHALLGDEAGTRQYLNTGHAGSPVKSIANLTRAYSFVAGNAGHTILIGYSASSRVDWGNGWSPRAKVIDDGGLQVWEVQR
jgi:hypothetical protein